MKFLQNNKGVIVFYLLVVIATLAVVYNPFYNKDNNSLVYVEK